MIWLSAELRLEVLISAPSCPCLALMRAEQLQNFSTSIPPGLSVQCQSKSMVGMAGMCSALFSGWYWGICALGPATAAAAGAFSPLDLHAT